MDERAGRVYLVGAGPGAPDLITVRGAQLLRIAEVVIYDSLASPELLALAPPGAELICAGKNDGGGSIDQAELNRRLIEHARAGRRVVRLEGGDPFIFGRGGEEAEALAAAAIPFEVVPGVTSATAAPAFAGIPLTDRKRATFAAFVAAHQDETKDPQGNPLPWDELASAAKAGGTLVLLMAPGQLRESLARLARQLPASTPAAVVQWAASTVQRSIAATIATLAGEAESAGPGAPSVVVIGDTAALGARLNWFERMPLYGRRIVITRAREVIGSFAAGLRALGAEVLEFPTIETAAPDSYAVIDAALERVASFDWVIFTSATGVERLLERMRTRGTDLRAMAGAKLGAIGPATAARLAEHALTVAALPQEYRAEAIIEAIGAARIRDARILLPRAQAAREVLPEMLAAAGAREVVVAPVYKTVRPGRAPIERVREMAKARTIDLAVFTSSSTVTNFGEMIGSAAARGLKAAAIGPVTAETARAAGMEVVVQPGDYTIAALIDAIRDYFKTQPIS